MRIAIANTARAKDWKNVEISWVEFADKLRDPRITHLTLKEYLAMPKAKQGEIKDVGGYVGGYLSKGRRKVDHVKTRTVLTLDIDNRPAADLLDRICDLNIQAVVHSTFKSTPEKPRYRIVAPLDQPVSPTEYQAIARRIADNLGLEQFDPTTFEPHRLMYWPAIPSDTEYFFEEFKGAPIESAKMLDTYMDHLDSSEWPTHKGLDQTFRNKIQKQQDPTEKNGPVGAFCRTYTISEAIAEFLTEEYLVTDTDDRFTYAKGEAAAGLVVYEDKWAYSHHGTDPASGKLCNAFDLVRVHKFGTEEDDPDKPANSQPSFKRMMELAAADQKVAVLMLDERKASAEDFDIDAEDDTQDEDEQPKKTKKEKDWRTKLERHHKTGEIESTSQNISLILRHDEEFKGKLKFNEFDSQSYLTEGVSWRPIREAVIFNDVDYAGVRHHLETYYGITGKQKIDDALALEFHHNRFHPVKDYLESLEWDGTERLDTFLIDYFAAKDTLYTRMAMRKTLAAAVQRIYHPGSKFDYMLILVGGQGAGKSQMGKALCKANEAWFGDNFRVSSKENKMEEQIQGVWITEMPEMGGFSKADVNDIKSFVTRTFDSFRPAYGRVKQTYYRQGIMIGTTNDQEFLRDPTGDRRFWPVDINKDEAEKQIFDITLEEVNQLWAEAKYRYQQGERLYLLAEEERQAVEAQLSHTIRDSRQGVIEKYLDTMVPENWDEMSLIDRRQWLENEEWRDPNKKLIQRDYICTAEIWCECFGKSKEDMDRYKTRELNDIMRGHPDWVHHTTTKKFSDYGLQKFYQRKIKKK